MKIFLGSWYFYILFVQASYECNLRAYLMAVDKEPPVDNAKDIYDQGRKLLFTPQFPAQALITRLPNHKIFYYEKALARESLENNYTFSYTRQGLYPLDVEKVTLIIMLKLSL